MDKIIKKHFGYINGKNVLIIGSCDRSDLFGDWFDMVEKSFTKKQKKYYEVCIVDLMDAYYSLFADSGENVDTDLSLFYLPDEDGFETMFITHDPQLNQKHLYLYFLHYAGQFKGDTSNAE